MYNVKWWSCCLHFEFLNIPKSYLSFSRSFIYMFVVPQSWRLCWCSSWWFSIVALVKQWSNLWQTTRFSKQISYLVGGFNMRVTWDHFLSWNIKHPWNHLDRNGESTPSLYEGSKINPIKHEPSFTFLKETAGPFNLVFLLAKFEALVDTDQRCYPSKERLK